MQLPSTTWYLLSFNVHTHIHTNTLTSEGLRKGPFLWGGGADFMKSASWKNSQLLSTWPYTIVRKRRGGTDGVREQGDVGAGGVGGQRLKLHHKSHPERKHEVTPPPPFSIHPSLPCGPACSSHLPYVYHPSLCFCVQRVPHGWTRCILYYSFMYFKRQTAQFLLNPSSLYLPLLPLSLPSVYQPIARL